MLIEVTKASARWSFKMTSPRMAVRVRSIGDGETGGWLGVLGVVLHVERVRMVRTYTGDGYIAYT